MYHCHARGACGYQDLDFAFSLPRPGDRFCRLLEHQCCDLCIKNNSPCNEANYLLLLCYFYIICIRSSYQSAVSVTLTGNGIVKRMGEIKTDRTWIQTRSPESLVRCSSKWNIWHWQSDRSDHHILRLLFFLIKPTTADHWTCTIISVYTLELQCLEHRYLDYNGYDEVIFKSQPLII